ncbi:ABC transporter permease [Paenibacillus sp. GCM10027626]|uniref:ABC transporter permease n=1 Tax=Paenibacillus sp. GCM10027626 TaxID=3273411 RepID=UPI0036328F97
MSATSPATRNPAKRDTFRQGLLRFRKEAFFQYMALMGGVFLLVFSYLPMFGIVMAFQDFDPAKGYIFSRFVGWYHFRMLFSDDAFWLSARNSVILSVAKFMLTFISPIILALLLNELKPTLFKKFVQTASYLPYFISWVVIASMATTFFSGGSDGILNPLLIKLGMLKEAIPYLTYPGYYQVITVLLDVWKFTGFSAIIYIAAMAGIDNEVIEASIVDGATRFQRVYKITLPMIQNTIVVLLILGIGSMFTGGLGGSNFNYGYLLGNTLNMSASDVMDTYILRMGLQLGRFSFAAAAGLLLSTISLILVFLANWVAKKIDRDEQAIF